MRHILISILALSLHLWFIGCQSPRMRSWETVHYENAADNPSARILGIDFVSPNHGFGLTSFKFIETMDGGKSWIERAQADEWRLSSFEYLVFMKPLHFWIVGSEKCDSRADGCGLAWATADAGRNWSRYGSSNVDRLHAAQFCSPDVGWAVGDSTLPKWTLEAKIMNTIDGGRTWTEQQQPLGTNYSLLAVDCSGCKEVLAVGDHGVILHTTDGGKSWIQRDSTVTSTLFRVRFFGDHAWAVGTGGTLLRSDDRSVTWKRVLLATKESLTDILMLGNRGWIVGEKGAILSSLDGGDSWKTDNSGTSSDLNCLSRADTYVWAGGAKLTVLRLALSE